MIFPDKIPYMYLVQKAISLPKGEPIGRNSCVFLLTENRKDSYEMTKNLSTLTRGNYYRYYYFPFRYMGKIRGRRYNLNYTPKKKEIRNEIMKETGLMAYPNYIPGMGNDNHSFFFDLSEYMKIFFSMTDRMVATQKMSLFWTYVKSILTADNLKGFQKLVLVDISLFKNIKGPLKETMNNPVFILYYTLFKDYSMIKDLDMDFIFYSGKYLFKFNPSQADKDTYRLFMNIIKRLYKHINIDVADSFDEEKIMKNEREEIVTNEIKKSLHFTGEQDEETDIVTVLPEKKEPSEKEKEIDQIIDQKVKKSNEKIASVAEVKTKSENQLATKAVQTDVENQIAEDKELIGKMYLANKDKVVPKSTFSSARDEKLRKEQENLVVGNMTVAEMKKIDASHMPIPTSNVGNVLKTTNENMKDVKFANFNKTYIENVMPKDITDSFLALNDKSLPLFVRSVKVEDTSNELNYVDTYTIEFEDGNRQRSKVVVDIPKFIDDRFLWLGGNKKLILYQNFLLPVVKIDPDTVELVTNYNKMFIKRDEVKSFGTIERLYKLLSMNETMNNAFVKGDYFEKNHNFITTIEYDELSKSFKSYQYGKCKLFFDQNEAKAYAESKGIKIPENKMFIGYDASGNLFLDTDSQTTDKGELIIDIIIRNAPEEVQKQYAGIKSNRRLMYAKVKTMEKNIPVMVLLSFWEGFTNVMKKMGLSYRLSDSYPRDLKPSENVLRFKDCYLIYPENANYSLLMNGMRQMKTENYELAAFDTREPYFEILTKIYGKASIANALDNTYEFTIDPITKEVLTDMNLPTDLVELMIYAVKLLGDKQYTWELNEGLYRIRSAEIIPAILYDALAKNYITYKNSNGKKKFSIPRDIVIKHLLELKTVEDYSTLNPILELERWHTISSKGWRGINLADSYTLEKRSYDPSMIGIIGTATSPDGQVGVSRTLTLEPKIKSARGYVEVTKKEDIDKLKDVNLFSPGELAIPLGATRDDSIRLGHAIKQSKHVIPVTNSSPVLISTGLEENCRFNLSTDFVVNAKDNGKVVELDENAQIMVVEYSNGEHQAINLAPTIVKNGGGGFFESNILITTLKVGSKFKKNDPLAWNKDFFQNDPLNGCRMTMGTLSKVAIMSTYNTYEDATFITDKLSKAASSEMCFKKPVVLGKNSNVTSMVKVGDHIEIGDTLIQFDSSFEDESLNEFLSALSSDPRLEKEIMDSSKNNIRAKTAGVIEDIKIFSTVELGKLSPSLRKIVKAYYNKINERKELLSKYDSKGTIMKCGMMITDSTGKVEPNKFGVIRGEKVEDSVLIEFYIKHAEPLEVGSKIA